MLTIKVSLAFHEFTYEHTHISPNLLPGSNTVIEITVSYPPGRMNIAVRRSILAGMPR
jgi:hypothetical protein